MKLALVLRHTLRLLFILCLAALFASSIHATTSSTAPAVNALDAQQTAVPLSGYITFIEDPQKELTIGDMQRPAVAAKFKILSNPSSAINFGFTRSAYWLRFTISNASDSALERMVEIAYARLSRIDFFASNAAGSYDAILTGMARPFSTRPYPNRFFVFPLPLPAHSEKTIYIRIESLNSLQVPIQLWNTDAFHGSQLSDYIQQSWYYGMACVMILFHLLLYFTLRDFKSIIYILLLSFTALSLASINGLSQEFIWTDSPVFNEFSSSIFSIYAVASLVLFTRQMLFTSKSIPRIDWVLKVLACIFIILPLGLPFFYQQFIVISVLAMLSALLLVFYTGIYLALKRQRSAYFFVTSFAVLLFGSTLTALQIIGIIPNNAFTINAMQWGSALEMLLLSFALADRFNEMRREKEQARLHALDVQQKLMLTLQSTELTLEQSVKERIANLTANNAELTQVNSQLNAAYVSAEHSRQLALAAELQATHTLRELQSTQSHLIQSEKMASLGQLISGVAHEINTPIRAIQTHGAAISSVVRVAIQALPQLAAKQQADPIEAHALAISQAVDSVSVVVNALKAFTRSDHSQALTEAHLHESLETVLTIFQHQINKGVQVLRHFSPLPPMRGLHGELNQVWAHLIQNALQVMNCKGTLIITLRQQQQNAVVSFSDTGGGIQTGNGSGVGLDIARQIIEKHHGKISIEDNKPNGSTFSVYIPMVLT